MFRFFFFIFVIFFSFFTIPKIFAAQEFTVSLQATYSIPDQGVPRVRNEIRIKNNFSTIFSTQYALEIGSSSLRSIRAYDANNKDIPIQATTTEKKTSIALTFSDKVVGRDKERVFTIEYEHPDAALITGNVLEIDVPKITQSDAFQSYVVVVEVPAKYKNPEAVSPATFVTTAKENLNTFTFAQGAQHGINMLFGDKQQYAFEVKYHLQNQSISQGVSQIALIPDTAYQRVVYTSLQPKPENITVDEDGNWIATFGVDAQKDLTVVAKGFVTIYLKPTVPVIQKQNAYTLAESEFWPIHDGAIQAKLQSFKNPHAIYNYLVQNFSYDYRRLVLNDQRRRGAKEALSNSDQTLCQEFTDTFITFARAKGIPAREINGYAYTENPKLRPSSLVGDLLHAWPEYYDAEKKYWIPIDPTWGNTTGGVDYFSKLDFNHIAFVIHGQDPIKPYAAGMYKIVGKEGKDVDMRIVPSTTEPTMNLSLTPPSLAHPNTITVENMTGAAWYDVPIRVTTSPALQLIGKKPFLTLLPYEKKEIEIPVEQSSVIVGGQGSVTVTIGEESVRYDTSAGRISTTTFVGIGLGFCSLIAGGVLVFGFLKPRHLRR